MKLLSIIIPCYNSQDYMENCVKSLLFQSSSSIEIIIVNDGSSDSTADIAESFKSQYPDMIKVIHKENGGHGDAINYGLAAASGEYFKVVDSDDWVDRSAYNEILKTLTSFRGENALDMVISNFTYDKQGAKYKKVVNYRRYLPRNRVFGWEDIKNFRRGKYILMHSVIYRTQLLKDIELKLPKHTFYVDNIFVYVPLIYVSRMIYIDVDFYRYFIGRDDQSVNEQVMTRRIDQQIRVNKIMLEHCREYFCECVNPKLKHYLYHYLEIITTVSSILLVNSETEEHIELKNQLWKDIKEYDELLYYKLRNSILGHLVNLPGKFGRKLTISAYRLSQWVVGFS